MSAACHRSLYGYQLRTALALAVENPHDRRHLPAAGLQRRDHRDRPVRLAGRQRLPAERTLRRHRAAADRAVAGPARQGAASKLPSRKLDLVLLTVGANDIKFSGLVADVIISAGVERTLFNQGGQLATVPEAQTLLDRESARQFRQAAQRRSSRWSAATCRASCYVSYGHPAMAGRRSPAPADATVSTSIRRSPPTPRA